MEQRGIENDSEVKLLLLKAFTCVYSTAHPYKYIAERQGGRERRRGRERERKREGKREGAEKESKKFQTF